MANRNGKGPQNQGAMTGRGLGNCNRTNDKSDLRCFDNGQGNSKCGSNRGRKNKRRNSNGFNCCSRSNEEDSLNLAEKLLEEKSLLEERINQIDNILEN